MRTFVHVGGRRIATYSGERASDATVVIPGAGLVGLDYLTVGAALLYDRAGTGWSDPVPLPRSAADVAYELHAVLGASGLPGPYVLVAHSMGAIYARRYAQLFPADVKALLLIDPGHEDLFAFLPPEALALNEQMKPDAATLPDLTDEQVAAARAAYDKLLADWPAEPKAELIDYHLSQWRVGLTESVNLESEVYQELRDGGPVPDVPVTVLTAGGGNPAWQQYGSPELIRKALDGIAELHSTIAGGSRSGDHTVLDGASHQFLHIEKAGAVRTALDELIARSA